MRVRGHVRDVAIVAVAAAMGLIMPLATAQADDPPSPTPGTEVSQNQPPLAASDSSTVQAGRSVTIPVLDNDSDDGLGRPEGTPPALEVASVDADERVSFSAKSVTFQARAADAGPYDFGYVVSDGELTAVGRVTVTVTAAPEPRRRVSLSTARTVVALRSYRLTGRVTPAGKAAVVVQRRVGNGRWRRLAERKADSTGRFPGVPLRATRLGRLRVRAVASWPGGARATSPVLDRRVTARPDLRVSGALRRGDVPFSYRTGCPVAPAGLRRLTVSYLGYDHVVRRGQVVVAVSAVPAMKAVLTSSLRRRFVFRRLVPVDRFYDRGRRTPTQSDLAAMRADNTSAFNCRPVTGNPYRLSQHSYGNAVDINTVRNPYVTGGQVYPAFARSYLDRSRVRPGMILPEGVVARSFRSRGWLWGARWSHPDYQHFSSNGG